MTTTQYVDVNQTLENLNETDIPDTPLPLAKRR